MAQTPVLSDNNSGHNKLTKIGRPSGGRESTTGMERFSLKLNRNNGTIFANAQSASYCMAVLW